MNQKRADSVGPPKPNCARRLVLREVAHPFRLIVDWSFVPGRLVSPKSVKAGDELLWSHGSGYTIRDDDPNDQLPSNEPDSEAEASEAVKPEMLPF